MNFEQNLSNILTATMRANSWTELRNARLGNGEVPAKVIVPAAERERTGMLYCHRVVDQTREVFQALNLSPSISYSDEDAFTPIIVGYPPNSTVLSIYMLGTDALNMTGGPMPSQVQANNAQFVSPYKLTFMRIYPYEELKIGLTGGWWRTHNQLHFLEKTEPFLDLREYLPGDADTTRFLVISLSPSLTGSVRAGDTFPDDDENPFNYIPAMIIPGDLLLGFVQLDYGQTLLTDEDVIPNQDLLFVPATSVDELTGSDPSAPTTLAEEYLIDDTTFETEILPVSSSHLITLVEVEITSPPSAGNPTYTFGTSSNPTQVIEDSPIDNVGLHTWPLALRIGDGLGLDEILNGWFSDWTGSDPNAIPDDWTRSGTEDANNMTQDASAACRLLSESGGAVAIAQTILTAGRIYEVTINVTDATLGGIEILLGTLSLMTLTAEGIYKKRGIANGTDFKIIRSGATDVTFTQVEVTEVTDINALTEEPLNLFIDPDGQTFSGRLRITRISL